MRINTDSQLKFLLPAFAAAQIQVRLTKLEEIERAVENRFTKEGNLQRLIEKSPWLFGASTSTPLVSAGSPWQAAGRQRPPVTTHR